MAGRKLNESELFDRLTDLFVEDILDLSDEEVLAEARAQYDDPEREINRLRNVINSAILHASKAKLAKAKESLAAYKRNNHSGNVDVLSMAQKRAVIERFIAQDMELQQKLTLAARKGEGIQTENDIEGMFEDLIELGLIDEEGNPK